MLESGGMTQDLVKSAARAFEIMEAFAAERRRLTATQLGGLLGYPKSSMNVLLKSLTAQGYLAYEPGDASYFPTLKLTHLGDWLPSVLFGSDVLLPMLAALRDATDETVTLTMATGLHMRCLRVLIGRHPIALQLDEGILFPIFDTAVGNAYLSTLSDQVIASLLQRRNAQMPRGKQLLLPQVLADIEAVRAKGYSAAFEKVVPDAGAVAVPLHSSQFGETLVVAVAGLNSRVAKNEPRIIRELKRLTRTVERAPPATMVVA
jgi:DNA-binding IclR family transcriptional regulator